jgi:hypothetical protein
MISLDRQAAVQKRNSLNERGLAERIGQGWMWPSDREGGS